jgi:hypothetical protein
MPLQPLHNAANTQHVTRPMSGGEGQDAAPVKFSTAFGAMSRASSICWYSDLAKAKVAEMASAYHDALAVRGRFQLLRGG